MAKKNILIKTNNAGAWDELYPITAAGNVKTTDGSDVEAQLMGNRTIDQALTSPSNTGTITKLFSWIAGRIKGITGKNNWYDAPATTIEELNSNRISKTLITAANDFIIGSANATVAKKTLAETKTILGVNGASESATGVVELATAAETTAGTDSTRAVHPAGLKVELDKTLRYIGTVAAGANFNNYNTNGMWSFGATSGMTNVPGFDWGILRVSVMANGYILQEAISVSNSQINYRVRTETTWGVWAEIGSTKLSKNGDTMTGALGVINVTHRNAGAVQYGHEGFHHADVLRWAFMTEADAGFAIWDFDASGNSPRRAVYINKSTGKLYNLNYEVLTILGGTMGGPLIGQNNTAYTTPQMRNVIESTADPSGGSNGDIWIKYKP